MLGGLAIAEHLSYQPNECAPENTIMLEYHSAYYAIDDGWYMVRVLDFPGVISQGRDLEHARRMIKDALCLMAEHKLEQGEPLPKPNPRARDKKAERIEPIKLRIRADSYRADEMTKRSAVARSPGKFSNRDRKDSPR